MAGLPKLPGFTFSDPTFTETISNASTDTVLSSPASTITSEFDDSLYEYTPDKELCDVIESSSTYCALTEPSGSSKETPTRLGIKRKLSSAFPLGLEGALSKYPDGRIILMQKCKLNNDLRNKLTKLIVTELFAIYSINGITPEILQGVSSEIEDLFFCERSDTYYTSYNPENKSGPKGKLYSKYVNTRASLKLANCYAKNPSCEKDNLSPEKTDVQKNLLDNFLDFLSVGTEPINKVFEAWQETYQLRKKKYVNAELLKIYEDFPCLHLNCGIELIETDFNKKHPNAIDAIYSTWADVSLAILAEAEERKLANNWVTADKSVQALLTLPYLFNAITVKKSRKEKFWRPSRSEVQESFFFHLELSKFHLSQTFNIWNGYKMPKNQYIGIGGRELDSNSVKHIRKTDTTRYDPSLTYGRCKTKPLPQFIPHYALYDQKCLTFKAFFKQSVQESSQEFYRVRPVNIIYFLEDDTITVIEPRVPNSGLLQGKLVRRSHIPKRDDGSYWHWKDLAVGKDLAFYGTVYHTVDCDLFTREYMASQGLDMGHPEEMPYDPYTFNRQRQVIPRVTKTPPADDKLRRFLEYDGKVLRFKAAWDDRENDFGELMKFEILYFLCDDTVAVKNVQEENSGRDPYPVLLRKIKLPKIYTDTPVTYPAIYLEMSDNEVTEYYQPKDFLVGNTIFVLGRDMLLYDCDKFTRDYFRDALCIKQKPPIDVEITENRLPPPQVPPHDGLGSLEDSLQNTLTFLPKPPKKDVMKQIVNANKNLRYIMKMDAVHPEDSIRRFILLYSLADGTCKIQEPPIKNSGIIGGKYLRSTLLVKPGSDPLNPELYTPSDFYIGALIIVFGQRFIITGADLYVYRYMQENCSKFPCEVIENMRNWMFNQGHLKDDLEDLVKEKVEAENKFDETIDEEKQTEMEKCLRDLNVHVTDSEMERAKQDKVLQEYEDSIKHTYKVPPHGILSVNKDCAYPVYTGEQKDLSCTKDIEGKYTSYTPKHVDTPEEIVQKYYAGVLKEQKEICDGKHPIVCMDPPINDAKYTREKEEKSGPILISPPHVPPEACKIKRKAVTFQDDNERCTTNRNDLCGLKKEITNCDCTEYQACH